ncbi:MAG: SDR family oxidoreductase [Myxococcales bacterium]|nr:SDR family oxidoreductase [Myxococcales bacterium]MCB9532370.1 SDR family oxidoreductase [Myxococcales bacterium]
MTAASPRVVLVTGGTKGIGRTIAETYLADGCTVVVCARTPPEAPISVGDATAEFVACNVRSADEVAALFDTIVARHGRIDVAINNAGGAPHVDAATASPRFHASIIDLNLTAPLAIAQRAYAAMGERGGVIINICSVSGTRPSPGTAAYGAAKAGLLSLTRSLAVEWAPKVRVVAVVAGLIETEQSHLHYGDTDGIARVAATVPLGRLGTPADIAEACRYLSSPAASYVSGSAITLDGGGEWPSFLAAAKG